MADASGDFPTILGSDAKFKGDLTFEKGVRIEGVFEGHIKSKGSLQVAEGAKVTADIEATNVRLEGECNGNVTVTEKLQLMSTAKLVGDLTATRLEIADGAIFSGKVNVGQMAMAESSPRRASAPADAANSGMRGQPGAPQRPAQAVTAAAS